MRMEKNKRSTLRKKIVGILCIAAMTASLATGMAMSVMAVPEQAATPEIVTEAVSLPQYASTSVMDEANAIQITLGADHPGSGSDRKQPDQSEPGSGRGNLCHLRQQLHQ